MIADQTRLPIGDRQFSTTTYPQWLVDESDVSEHAQEAVPVYVVQTRSQRNEAIIKFFLTILASALAAIISGIVIIHYTSWLKHERYKITAKISKFSNPLTIDASLDEEKAP